MRRLTTALVAAALPLALTAFTPVVTDTDEEEESPTESTESTTESDDVLTPDPISVTMYFHGDDTVDVIDDDTYAGATGGILSMDRTAPTDNSYETRQLVNYLQGPNAACSGNGLFPVWTGWVGDGTLSGFGTVTFRSLGSVGGDVLVEVFADVTGTQCNESYVEPVATTQVTLPAGEGEVTAVLDLDGVEPDSSIMVQLRPVDSPASTENPIDDPGAPIWPAAIAPHHPQSQTRIVYDGTNFLSNISFTCQPDDVTVDEGETAEEALAGADCLPF